ncbi:MAG: tyrosine-type recombinase/integrase [Phenylobacterium sp.]|uniref:tyrosine-type recombinase/integrase n=1 Tax=Phenylobacterium sp. TaxID=1871053 RepID=UPI00391B8A64
MLPLVIRMHIRPCGERLPLLMHRSTGLPHHTTALYVLTQCRARRPNTIHQQLVGVQALLLWCAEAGISLESRVASGTLLSPAELDGLVAAASFRLPERFSGRDTSARVVQIKKRSAALSRQTAANRVRAIRQFLVWLTQQRLLELSDRPSAQAAYAVARDAFLASVATRTPGSNWADDEPREGLEEEERLALTDLVDPQSSKNPWSSHSVRFRNHLIIQLLLDLGLRRGELLALRVEDVDLRRERLNIVARPDDPRDPRARQPVLKTEERVLALPKKSAELLAAYVLEMRPVCGAARKHGYLFVSTAAGSPLSVSSVEKLFRVVRKAAGLPSDFSCHVLRHDWNERFWPTSTTGTMASMAS